MKAIDFTKLTAYCEQNHVTCGKNVPLRERCTFKIGGPAALFLEPSREEDLAQIVQLAHSGGIPLLVMGRGSNLLISDAGFPGAVICFGGNMARMELLDGDTVYCQSGASLTQLCLFAQKHGLSGLEFAYGIPGTVGGAVYMNAGAYGGEIKDVAVKATHITLDGQPGDYHWEQLNFSYRHSVYTENPHFITGAVFQLKKGNPEEIHAKMEEFMGRRREKQPLEYPSAGSTFKRPEGAYASALIDGCGLKGRRVGDAMVSEKHAGFVINAGNATCRDVLALMEEVQQEVWEKTGHRLLPEVKVIG